MRADINHHTGNKSRSRLQPRNA